MITGQARCSPPIATVSIHYPGLVPRPRLHPPSGPRRQPACLSSRSKRTIFVSSSLFPRRDGMVSLNPQLAPLGRSSQLMAAILVRRSPRAPRPTTSRSIRELPQSSYLYLESRLIDADGQVNHALDAIPRIA